MKLLLEIAGKKELDEVEVRPFTLRMKEGLLCITTPDFDDWTRTTDFDLRIIGADVYPHGSEWVIRFAAEGDLAAFQAWLTAANSKADKGYKTMWP